MAHMSRVRRIIMNGEIFLSNITYLCKKRNISIAQLEKSTDIVANSIKRWGTVTPGVDKVERVAAFLGVSIEALISKPLNTEYIENSDILVDNLLARTYNGTVAWIKPEDVILQLSKSTHGFYSELLNAGQSFLDKNEEWDLFYYNTAFNNGGSFLIVNYYNVVTENNVFQNEYALFLNLLLRNGNSSLQLISHGDRVAECYNYISNAIYGNSVIYAANQYIHSFMDNYYPTVDNLPEQFNGCYTADDKGNIISINTNSRSAKDSKEFFEANFKFTSESVLSIDYPDEKFLSIIYRNGYQMFLNKMDNEDKVQKATMCDICRSLGFEVYHNSETDETYFSKKH